MTALTWLDLSINQLTGTLPASVTNLPSSLWFSVRNNNLNGTLSAAQQAFLAQVYANNWYSGYTGNPSLTQNSGYAFSLPPASPSPAAPSTAALQTEYSQLTYLVAALQSNQTAPQALVAALQVNRTAAQAACSAAGLSSPPPSVFNAPSLACRWASPVSSRRRTQARRPCRPRHRRPPRCRLRHRLQQPPRHRLQQPRCRLHRR